MFPKSMITRRICNDGNAPYLSRLPTKLLLVVLINTVISYEAGKPRHFLMDCLYHGVETFSYAPLP
jgi:hypothetical protein